jgi:hypothetical protein
MRHLTDATGQRHDVLPHPLALREQLTRRRHPTGAISAPTCFCFIHHDDLMRG